MLFYLDTKDFGRVYIMVRSNCRKIVARWKNGQLRLTVPPGIAKDRVLHFLEQTHDSISRLSHSTVSFHLGQTIECFRCRVTLGEQNLTPGKILFGRDGGSLYLNLPAGLDVGTDAACRNISAALQILMAKMAVPLLLPYAREVAGQLGVQPAAFQVGRGVAKLGHCTRQGVIQLSRNVMFLPDELVHLIVCHELAHITHFNHSPEFHALLNDYVDGNERNLENKLKAFQWPIWL